MGADVLRLWIASTEYSSEQNVSDEILTRASDAYRRIRNTLRYLLSNLDGFEPSVDKISANDMVELDHWIVWKTKSLQDRIKNIMKITSFILFII